jgi:cytochrome P450
MATDDLIFNPFDPAQTRTSWEKLARLRRECPVSHPVEGLAYTAKLQDTRDVFRDGRRFTLGEAGMRKPGAVVPYEERFLGEIDPPQHPRIRRLLVPYFTRAAALTEEPFTRSFIRAHLEAVAGAGGGNLSTAFSAIVPIAITAHVIGLGTDDVPAISRDILSNEQAEHFLSGTLSVADAFPELSAFVDAAIDARLASDDPPDDAMTAMLLTEDAEIGRMSRHQVRTLAVNLLSGSGSTSSLLDNLFHRTLSDPAFDAALRGDAALIPKAVEESLRLEPPVLFLFRTAMEPTELSGVEIPVGERICMGIASANRDEEHYTASEDFRIDREGEPEHVSFGWGPHLCIGIHLARMEARLALEELYDLFAPGQLRLADGYRYEFPTDDFLRYAPTRLDVTVQGAPA